MSSRKAEATQRNHSQKSYEKREQIFTDCYQGFYRFIKVVVIDSLVRLYLHRVVSWVSSNRHGLSLTERTLNPNREQFVMTKMCKPLEDPEGHCAMLAIGVVHRCHS